MAKKNADKKVHEKCFLCGRPMVIKDIDDAKRLVCDNATCFNYWGRSQKSQDCYSS